MKKLEEVAKGNFFEAQVAIEEKNIAVLQKAVLAKEVEELREKLVASEQAHAKAKLKKAKEIFIASVEAVEAYRSSNELKGYILNRLVDKQVFQEETLAKFNPMLDINFDTTGTPPPQSIFVASPADGAEAIAETVMDAQVVDAHETARANQDGSTKA